MCDKQSLVVQPAKWSLEGELTGAERLVAYRKFSTRVQTFDLKALATAIDGASLVERIGC